MNDKDSSNLPEQNHVDSLSTAYCQDIRPFIDVIDNLRSFGLQQDIDLPKVVVVGDQSSGKSSIIEAISGIQLPRGIGIVTRCPLELQLKRVIGKPWKALISYKDQQGVLQTVEESDPNAVEESIRDVQDEICGDKDINEDLITLRVESPVETAPDLTLIDLPGIARTAMDNQKKDICKRIRNIIMTYIDNENTVILCVVSANVDAAATESISIAKEVDPDGTRTFGVITKPDTAEKSNKKEVLRLLNNEKIKLVKGFHMVKCRSQTELDWKMTLIESLENEKEYFKNDKIYKTASKSLLGIPNLASKITEELVEVIQANLPKLRDNIYSSLQETRGKLVNLREGVPEGNQEKLIYLIGVITDMNNEIKCAIITGKNDLEDDNLFYRWRKEFNKLRQKIDLINESAIKNEFSIARLKDAILKKRGNELSGFLNFELFESLMKTHVTSYKTEAEAILQEMTKYTDSVLQEIIQKYFANLPFVASNLKQIARDQLEIASNKALERISTIFDEENLIYTSDNAFDREMEIMKKEQEAIRQKEQEAIRQREQEAIMKKNKKTTNLFGNNPQIFEEVISYASSPTPSEVNDIYGINSATENLEENANRMSSLIECYLKIVQSRLCDTIPMSIRQCLHVELCSSLKRKFIEYATSEEIESKITENKKLTEERTNLKEKIKRLQYAAAQLSSFH